MEYEVVDTIRANERLTNGYVCRTMRHVRFALKQEHYDQVLRELALELKEIELSEQGITLTSN